MRVLGRSCLEEAKTGLHKIHPKQGRSPVSGELTQLCPRHAGAHQPHVDHSAQYAAVLAAADVRYRPARFPAAFPGRVRFSDYYTVCYDAGTPSGDAGALSGSCAAQAGNCESMAELRGGLPAGVRPGTKTWYS